MSFPNGFNMGSTTPARSRQDIGVGATSVGMGLFILIFNGLLGLRILAYHAGEAPLTDRQGAGTAGLLILMTLGAVAGVVVGGVAVGSSRQRSGPGVAGILLNILALIIGSAVIAGLLSKG